MNKEEIRNHILKTLWDSWDKDKNIGLYLGVFSPRMFEQFEDTVVEVIEKLKSEELYIEGYRGELTAKGIIHAEEQNLADAERALYHQNLRHKILSFLFQLNENSGYSTCIHSSELCEQIDTDIDIICHEYALLGELGFVKNQSAMLIPDY